MGQLCPGSNQPSPRDSRETARSVHRPQSSANREVVLSIGPGTRNNNHEQMGNSAIKQHYETAKKTGVLKLSRANLDEFPPSITQLDQILRTLDLSQNKFTEIPVQIGSFENLKHLNFNRNRLMHLPDVIGTLSKLESLSVVSNRLTELPQSLLNLSHLKQVNLSDNQLTVFPLMFNGIVHLDALDLSKNKITVVPDGVADLRVTELNLNQNALTVVSDKLADCPRLKTLRLEENCLQLSAINKKILTDSKVSTLTLEGNLFDMKSFQEADGYDDYMERYTAVKKKMF